MKAIEPIPVPVQVLTAENGKHYENLRTLWQNAIESGDQEMPTVENKKNFSAMCLGKIRPSIVTVTACNGCKVKLQEMLQQGVGLFEAVRADLPGVDKYFAHHPLLTVATFDHLHVTMATWQTPGMYNNPEYKRVGGATLLTLSEIFSQVWAGLTVAGALDEVCRMLDKAAEARNN